MILVAKRFVGVAKGSIVLVESGTFFIIGLSIDNPSLKSKKVWLL